MKIAPAEFNRATYLMKSNASDSSASQTSNDPATTGSTSSSKLPAATDSVTVGEKQFSPQKSGADGDAKKTNSDSAGTPAGNPKNLDAKALAVISDLKQTDKKVRAHEAAHIAAGGKYVSGGASYEYQTGPDGKRYAVGGEVQIDTSEVPDNPEATIAKMQVVRRAALAPSEPSSQDRSVAAAASRKMSEARIEMSKETQTGDKADKGEQAGNASDKNRQTEAAANKDKQDKQMGEKIDRIA